MADDTSVVDYLGVPAPLALNDKAALPVPGPIAPGGTSTASVGGGGTASPVTATAGTSLTGTPAGAASGTPAGGSSDALSSLSTQLRGLPQAARDSFLDKLVGLGGDAAKVAGAVKKLLDGGTDAPGVPKVDTEKNTDLGVFEGLAGDTKNTDLGVFEGLVGDAAGQSPNTDLGPFEGLTEPTAPETGGLFANLTPENILSFLGPLLSAGGKFGEGDFGKALSATGAVVGEGVTAATNPVLAAWNLPGVINTIQSLIEGDAAGLRRMKRGRDAESLQAGVLQPLTSAKSPEEFVAALAKDVGGAKIGDTLAAILNDNASGGWFTETGHSWLPDTQLAPLREGLKELGYTGGSSASKNDVGGAGEMVQAAGGSLVPRAVVEYLAGANSPVASEGGGVTMTPTPEVRAWLDANLPDFGKGGFDTTPSLGAIGWDATLRDLEKALGVDVVAQTLSQRPPAPEVVSSGETTATIMPEFTPSPIPGLDPQYVASLGGDQFAEVQRGVQERLDMMRNWAEYAGGGG